ncbi:sigma-54-dependent Fis family transcriptional regulator [bacterium]|nr:sigma-54-dependent Fis family transcriptional regulator [candidate division CSSED10-310 bacterium]
MAGVRSKIMIVDDEPAIRESLAEALANQPYQIDLAASGEEAVETMSGVSLPYSLVLTDLKMPGLTGEELLHWIKDRYPATEVVIITAYATVENAVQAIKDGATDYLTKPIDIFRFRKMVQNIIEKQQLLSENRALRRRLKSEYREPIIGSSSSIRDVYETVDRVADTDASVLIEGASGTGKELIARALHGRSSRRDKPFVIVNCAAMPDTLLENELFGHEKEAFTGAASQKKGRFESANEGTLFLDEITEMSLESQSGFLRVLEDGCFHRVGGSDLIQVDVRIISASNRNVFKACEEGHFRFDLYYRLNVVPINMPLLKDRQEDIPILIHGFLEEFSYKYNRSNMEIDPQVIKAMMGYSWPGNIRELKNMIERAVILCRQDKMTFEHFPLVIRGNLSRSSTDDVDIFRNTSLRDMERIMISRTLKQVGGHRKQAANILGISVRALQYKIKDFQIEE